MKHASTFSSAYFYLLVVMTTGLIDSEKIDDLASSKMTFNLRLKKLKTNTESVSEIKIEEDTLNYFKVSKEEVISSWLEEDSSGTLTLVTPTGRRIIVQQEFVSSPSVKHVTLTLSIDQNVNLTMKDIIADPDFLPKDQGTILWSKPSECLLNNILIIIDYDVIIMINNENVSVGSVPDKDFEGLLLTSINPRTCSVTYRKTFPTNEFGTYRNLMTTLDDLAIDRVVILASQFEGSLMLAEEAKSKIARSGSFLVNHFLINDNWVYVFVKGGKTLADVMVPNLGYEKNENVSAPPIKFHVDLQVVKNPPSYKVCPEWPDDEIWNARRIFCETHDALGRLCHCKKPSIFQSTDSETLIPIIIVCGGRMHTVNRLLESLIRQPGIFKETFILVLDGDSMTLRQLAFIYGLKVIIHGPEGFGPIRVSRNLRFGLFNAIQIFPKASSFIVLEDDLLLSPDFYSYMNQLFPIFEMDKSIFAVSGFNYFSFPHSSSDPTLTYRINWLPPYGWMMHRKVLEEIIPKWPHKLLFHDWDYFISSEFIRKDRQIIVPDTSRAYHDCNQNSGVHLGPSWFAERNFLRQKLNDLESIKLKPLDRLAKGAYEEEIVYLLSIATPVVVRNAYKIVFSKAKLGVYVIYVKKNSETDASSMQVLSDGLGVWTGDPTHHEYNHTYRISYNNSTLLIVGVPLSPYSRFRAHNYQVFSALEEDAKNILNGDLQRKKIHIKYNNKDDLENIYFK